MFYIVKFTHYQCDQLEGYTDNEFIFRQYIRQLNRTFRNIEYTTAIEELFLDDMLDKYEFKKIQKIRSYSSADKTTVVYCNILFMSNWLGIGTIQTPWSMTGRERVPKTIKAFFDATVAIFQLSKFFYIPNEATVLDGALRRLVTYAVRAMDSVDTGTIGEVLDSVKLISYINNFPNDINVG